MPFPKVVDSTMLTAFRACERKFHWAYIKNLAPNGDNIHLHAGGAMAAGLEVARNALVAGDPDWQAKGLATLWLAYGEREAEARGKDWLTLSRAYASYWSEWPPDGPLRIETIEPSFAIPTEVPHPETGEEILYAGRCDWIGSYKGQLWVVDEKTTSQMGQDWASQWRMRGQLLGYAYALSTYAPCAGVVVRGICLGAEIRFSEVMLVFPRWELERWFAQMRESLRRAIECYRRGEWIFTYGDACNAYGGCPYKPLCLSANPENWFGDYKVREWNPLERS